MYVDKLKRIVCLFKIVVLLLKCVFRMMLHLLSNLHLVCH